MKTLEERCLEKLNKLLSKFDLKIVIIRCQHRLAYKNDTVNWISLWLSMSDMLFRRTITIFDCLNSYYEVISDPSFKRCDMSKDTLSRFQACSDAYKEIISLKSDSLEEFLINCDLMGV